MRLNLVEGTEMISGKATEAALGGEALRGLGDTEVAERKARGEVNLVAPSISRSYTRILFENAFTPINVMLFAISVVLVAIGLFGDAVMTAGLVLMNVVVGMFQEGRAKRRLDQIYLLARPRATVLRNGEEVALAPGEIVRDDLVLLTTGDEIQVDGLVVEAWDFGVDESLLTGESELVPKQRGDRIYSGAFCMTGRAVFRADRVGAESFAQQITAKARTFRSVRTPLQREVSLIILGMALTVTVLSILVTSSLISFYGHLPLEETVRAAAVIVALVPQGLAFMVTVTYAMAAVRIAGTGALVQRMNAVESMSHVDVLCTDKTGTLTTNQLKLEALQPIETDETELRALLGSFAASVTVPNRTLAAVRDALPAEARGVRLEVPFDSAKKWSALAFEEEDAVYVLGAPEVLEPWLTARDGSREAVERWVARGLRVLLFARTPRAEGETAIEAGNLPGPLTPLGLIVLSDVLRTEAAATVARFAAAGIRLKVLSGDHPETVSSLARQAGIDDGGQPVSGSDLDALDESHLAATAEEASVFGRITPEHKERLLTVLQQRGHHVAMIGDGVNDVPALKRADVSVAMRSGSPVTRSVADIVLLQDSFAVLPAAFEEGQRIRAGMQGMIRLFLARTLSVSLLILATSLSADPFPTTPRQAGILALLTVGLPVLVLAAWARPARTPRYLLPSASVFVLPAALTIGLGSYLVFHFFFEASSEVDRARTAATLFATCCGLVILPFVEGRPGGRLKPDPRLIGLSAVMFSLLAVSIAIGPLRRFYELVQLSGVESLALTAAVCAWAAVFLLVWRHGPALELHALSRLLRSERARSRV